MEKSVKIWLWITNPEDYVHGDKATYYLCDHSGMEKQGWLLVKEVEVSVHFDLPSIDEVRDRSVDQLRETIKQVDAAAQRAKTELEGKIQNLLAIGYEAPKRVGAEDDITF